MSKSGRERVTGVGGVFFRARDPKALTAWYREHLGVPESADGYVVFPRSRDVHWVPCEEDTEYWPRDKGVMVNFTVRDLDAILGQLRAGGVTVDDTIEEIEFGRFGWCVDPEGNRIELWEPARGNEP